MNGNPDFCFSRRVEITNISLGGFKPLFYLQGFTLLEVLIVLAVLSILIVALQTPIEHFHKLVFNQQVESGLSMDVQRFALILKSELIQAGYGLADRNQAFEINNGTLAIKADLNQDGDLEDSREQIFYRFDSTKQRLLRKSGKGAYQRFIEGLTYLNFEYWPALSDLRLADCLKMSSQVVGQAQIKEIVLCPLML